ncbi:MAG TPA: hypothetical protein VG694_03330 [Candidatus Paceibacterota bacterium]|jgi:hypothetical protein|nr:hypothetical protein [Candidatus Paceibacterota bacterium]
MHPLPPIAQKIVSCLLIIAILSPAAIIFLAKPKQADAIFGLGDIVIDAVDAVPTVVQFAKDIALRILDQFLKSIARAFLNKMSNSIISWINSGFKGQPGFIQNPGQFFKNIADEQVKGFVNEIAYDPANFPFGKNFALGVIGQVQNQFQQNAQYSLSKLYTDQAELQNQINNFSAGGWNGLLLNTQLPQNNFLGFDFLASDQLANQLAGDNSPAQQVKDQVQQGLGFLSQQECKSNPNWDQQKLDQGPPDQQNSYNPPHTGSDTTSGGGGAHDAAPPTSGSGTSSTGTSTGGLPGLATSGVPAAIQYDQNYTLQQKQTRAEWEAKYGCPEGPSTVTPGQAVANQVTTALSSGQHQSELAAALGDVIGAVIDSLLNKLLNAGLSKLEGIISPSEANTNQSINGFNEYGNNLSGSGQNIGNPPTSFTQLQISLNVVNSNGTGNLTTADVQVYLDGSPVQANAYNSVTSGTHFVSVSTNNPAGLFNYSVTYGNDCDATGSISVTDGSTSICSVTLRDLPPGTVGNGQTGSGTATLNVTVAGLHLAAILQGDSFGEVNGKPVDSGPITYPTGTYTVSGVQYQDSSGTIWPIIISGDCAADGTIVLSAGDNKSCAVNYNPPGQVSLFGQLTVNIMVSNANGGSLTPDSVLSYVDGIKKNNGVAYTYSTGTHTVSGTSPAGYTKTFSGDCSTSGGVVLTSGSVKTCTITYSDTLASGSNDSAQLTVNVFTNSINGGTLDSASVLIFVDGKKVPQNQLLAETPGTHFITEVVPDAGYTESFGGDCASDGSITLSAGDVATCTITNTD